MFIVTEYAALNEEYYMDTEEKLSFFTTCFIKDQKNIKLYNLCIEPRRTFVLIDKYMLRI